MKLNKNRFKLPNYATKPTIIAVAVFALLGASLLLFTKAATYEANLEAESAQLSGSATTVNDTAASGGKAVHFGQSTGGTSGSGGSTTAQDLIVAIAGDIQDSNSGLHYGSDTAALMKDTIKPDYIMAIGDTQYEDGTSSDFNAYYSQTWGVPALKTITYPSPGNHEYHTSGAADFYTYFNMKNGSIDGRPVTGPADEGYYAVNLGSTWRLYSINTESDNYDTQSAFIQSDMAANPRPCTIIFGHKPYYDYGTTHAGDGDAQLGLLKMFYDNNGDLAFYGHEHNYQRFQPVNPSTDTVDAAKGIRSFVVGTGGTDNLYNGFGATNHKSDSLIEEHNGTSWGVLKLTLHSNSYDWQFVNIQSGGYTDSGSGQCH